MITYTGPSYFLRVCYKYQALQYPKTTVFLFCKFNSSLMHFDALTHDASESRRNTQIYFSPSVSEWFIPPNRRAALKKEGQKGGSGSHEQSLVHKHTWSIRDSNWKCPTAAGSTIAMCLSHFISSGCVLVLLGRRNSTSSLNSAILNTEYLQ